MDKLMGKDDPLEIMNKAHRRMDEIEKEITPLRNQVYILEREWERCGREASDQFRKLMEAV